MNTFFKYLTSMLLLMMISFNSYSKRFEQEKFNFYGGLGYPETYNIGARYQYDQVQFGLGTVTPNRSLAVFSADMFYHFGGYSVLSERRPLYFKIGVVSLHENRFKDNYLIYIARLGYDINIYKRFGINLEAGIAYDEEGALYFSSSDSNISISFGIYFFYKLITEKNYKYKNRRRR